MERSVDYELASLAIQMDARNPFEKINVGMVVTKKWVFTIPIESKAGFGIHSASNAFNVFNGVPMEDGINNLAAGAGTVENFENQLKEMLGDNPKWCYEIPELKFVKFTSMLGKQGVQLARKTKMERVNISFKQKVEGKALRAFHTDNK